jgi:hypothetical protein
MARNYTTISVSKDTQKVLEYLKSTGQSFDGQLREMAEEQTGKTFAELIEEAEQ